MRNIDGTGFWLALAAGVAAAVVALVALAAFAAPAFAQSLPADFVTATRYDAERRVTGTIAPDPDGAGPLRFAAVRNTYDPAGNLVKVEKGELAAWQSEAVAPASWTLFTVHQAVDNAYDLMGRKLKESLSGRDPSTGLMVLQTVTQTSWDPLGRVECTAVRMNPATFAALPASACTPATAHSTFGPDRITRNRYDPAGRLARVETGVGTSERRDLALYTYNANGKMASLTDSRGFRAEMRHDGHDRQVKWVFPSKTVPGRVDEADYEQYGWDNNGNRTSLRNRAGETIGYSYDALNRVIAKDVPETGGDVAYAYDLRGLQTAARYGATGLGIASAYDKAGRQTASTANLDGTSRTYVLAWDSNSNRTRLTHPDGPWFDYGHDGLDRMTTLKDNAGTALVTLAYDSTGQRDTATYANGVVTSYDYDPVGRLASLVHDFGGSAVTHDVTFGYAYSPASQIVSRTTSNDLYAYIPASADTGYAVNGLNQYIQVGGGAVAHDAKGNLTQEGGRALSYDSGNRLTGIVAAPQNFGIAYDPQGRFRGVLVGSTVAAFDMVGTDIVAARSNGGPTVERYAFGPGVDEPMVGYDNAGARYYFHADGHGNVVAHSGAAGSATRTIGYDEYGKPSLFSSRFLHAGKMHLGGVNAYYNNARFYDYNLGRFLQVDPVGYDGGINLYAYVGNDPLNKKDPSGTTECGLFCRLRRNVEGAAQGVLARAARVGMISEQTRRSYSATVSRLSRDDSAGRTAAKAQARAQTPREVRAVIEARRPGLGPTAGSGGTASRSSPGWNQASNILGNIGRASAVAVVAVAAIDIATSDNPGRAATANVGAVGGGLLGGTAGGLAGTFGGPAAPVTIPVGAVGGAIAGGSAGYELGERAYDAVVGD